MIRKAGLLAIALLMFWTAIAAEKTVERNITKLEQELAETSGEEKVAVLNELALAYRSISRPKTAEYSQKALTLARELGNKAGEATALMVLSRTYIQAGDRPKGLKTAQESVKAAEKANDKKVLGDTLGHLGITFVVLGEVDRGLKHLKTSMKLRAECGDEEGVADILTEIGGIYRGFKNDYATALEYGRRALRKKKEIGYTSSIHRDLYYLGGIHAELGDYNKALPYMLDAQEKAETYGDKSGAAVILNGIGMVYGKLDNHERSLKYYLEALNVRREMGNELQISTSLSNIGGTYTKMGKYRKGLEYLREALAINEKMGDKANIAFASHDIGEHYYKRKNHTEALKYFQRAVKIREEIGQKNFLASSLKSLGSVYLELGDLDRAYGCLQRGLEIAQKVKSKDELRGIREKLAELYAQKGDYKKAYEEFLLFFEVHRDIFNENKNKQMEHMQIRFDTLKNEKKIETLTKDKKIQKLKRAKERYAFIAGFILVAFVLALLVWKFFYLFSFWKKQKYIGRFRLLEPLGSGGMGTVYKAHGIRDKKEPAAVKILKPELFEDENNRKRFKQEGTIIDKLDHPHIVKIFERGEHQDRLYIAMELLQGRPLNDILKEQHRLPPAQSLHIMRQITGAVIQLHEKEIIHRDIKPGNIMVISKDGDPDFVKLLDFGLAQSKYQSRITETGMLIGTIDYIPPEHITGSVLTASGDVYSLGVTFYEMLTGHRVFPGETTSDIIKQILDTVPVAPNLYREDIPAPLNDLILSMLAKKRETRPVIKEVFDALKTIEAH